MEPTVVGVISAVSELGIAERRLVVTVVRDIRGPFFYIDRDRTIKKIVIYVANSNKKVLYFLKYQKTYCCCIQVLKVIC